MKATWDDESESESDEEAQEEIAKMCFMAFENEVNSLDNDDLLEDEFDEKPSYNELLDDFNDLYMKFEKLALKNNALKKKIFSLTKELQDSLEEKKKLTCETCCNLKKVNDLTKIVHNLTNGKKNFDLMLGKQKCVFDKGGIGYKPFLKTKYLKNYFIKASSPNDPNFVCNYCNQDRHISFYCAIKKNTYFDVKQVWVPKAPKTNSQGPKVMWVPKIIV